MNWGKTHHVRIKGNLSPGWSENAAIVLLSLTELHLVTCFANQNLLVCMLLPSIFHYLGDVSCCVLEYISQFPPDPPRHEPS